MRALVVEDDFISRRLLCRYLEPFAESDVAINGEEALVAVQQAVEQGCHYDLICLDIMMPGMGGQETLKKIRLLEGQQNIKLGEGTKIIMTTSIDDSKNIREAFNATADGYVVKPVEKKKFMATLSEIGVPIEIPL